MAVNIGGKKKTITSGSKNVMKKGMFPARLVQAVYAGPQKNIDFNTKLEVEEETFYFTFEFPTQMVEYEGEEKPRWLSRSVKISDYEKSNYYKIGSALKDPEGGDFDPEIDDPFDMIGRPAMVNVGHTKGGKAKVTDVNPPIDGFPVPELVNEGVIFNIEAPDLVQFFKLPDWLQGVCTSGVGFDGSTLSLLLDEHYSGDDA